MRGRGRRWLRFDGCPTRWSLLLIVMRGLLGLRKYMPFYFKVAHPPQTFVGVIVSYREFQ